MSGDGVKRGKRRGGLPDEDRALWEFVATSIEPTRGKYRVPDVEPPDPGTIVPRRMEGPVRSAHAPPRQPKFSPPPTVQKSPAPRPQEPLLLAIERKRARRIARGDEVIEARLDLHGMTQDDAHQALTGFIVRCHGQGLRFVLVITGKGGNGARRGTDDDVIPRPRGVLKRNVPRWLADPAIASLVVSYTTAQLRHGGDGALYVQLRVKR